MAKETVVTELETTKRSIFMVDPFKLLIVGIDFGGPGDVGYDERVKAPLDETMVESILQDGVQQIVKARNDGERMVVVDGRRRVMHARAANLRLQKANPGIKAEDLIRVKTELVRGDELTLFGVQEIANAYHMQDPPLVQARKIQAMLDKGADEKRVCLKFGITKAVLEDRLKMLKLAPDAITAVEKGEVTNNAALALSEVSMAEQVKILAEARDAAVAEGRAAGKLSTTTIQAASRAAKLGTTDAASHKTPKEIRQEVYKLVEELAKGVAESSKPLSPDGRAANPPDGAAMFVVVRKIFKLTHPDSKGVTFDSYVKACVKAMKDDADEESDKQGKAPKAAAAK